MFIGVLIEATIISDSTKRADNSFDPIVSKDFCCVEHHSMAPVDQETTACKAVTETVQPPIVYPLILRHRTTHMCENMMHILLRVR